VSAFAFSRVTFAGLLLNVAAIPLMTVVQVAGMLVLPAAAVHGGVASAIGWVAHLAAEGLIASADLVEWWPWLSYRLPPPHAATLVAYFGGWAAWFALGPVWWRALPPSRTRRRARWLAVAVVVGSGAWVLVEPVSLLVPGVRGVLRVAFLDVGHADAVLLQLPDRRSLLIDAGGSLTGSAFDIGGRVVAPALWSLGTRRLDVLVLSHGDPDHIGGAASVIRDFRPREIWEGIPVPPSRPLEALRRQAEAHGLAWRTCPQGAHGTMGEVTWHVWHPPPADWERQKVRNDDSIVLELRYRDVSIVLPGDIGKPVEQDLALAIPPAPLRILKVPHHGSASSSTAAFVSALQPRIAVLSAGATTKVSDAVLARYHTAGVTLFRTDSHGAVIVTTDGTTVTVTTFTGITTAFDPLKHEGHE
jgi:competence protein ComEC